jgi:hypothetical protein
LEKIFQKLGTLFFEDSVRDERAVIDPGVVKDKGMGQDGTRLRIIAPIDHSGYVGLRDGGSAHETRLQSDVERRAIQFPRALFFGGVPQRLDFGMGGYVEFFLSEVMPPTDDFVIKNHDGPHRNLFGVSLRPRHFDRLVHEVLVTHAIIIKAKQKKTTAQGIPT